VCVRACMVEQFAISHMKNSVVLGQQPEPRTNVETANAPYVTRDGNHLGGCRE
jgi:hypothetical protein